MKFAYEIQDKTVIIRRCFGYGDEIEIPGSLAGYPVTELAPYIFSEHFREEELKEGIEAGRVFFFGEDGGRALCGSRLRKVSLPPALQKIGAIWRSFLFMEVLRIWEPDCLQAAIV